MKVVIRSTSSSTLRSANPPATGAAPPRGGRSFAPAGCRGGYAMRTLTAAVLVLGLAGLTGADDKKADPTGTWKWTTDFGGQKREQTLKLKLEGDKLTGALSG